MRQSLSESWCTVQFAMESIPRASAPTLCLVYKPQGYQNNRQGYEGQNYRRFPYSQPFRAIAPLALPPAPQQAPVATQAMVIVPIQAQRPYVQRSVVSASHSIPTSHSPSTT